MSIPRPYWTDGLRFLYHGDCRAILPAIGGAGFGFCVADVPYGIALANHDPGGSRARRTYRIAGDDSTDVADCVMDFTAAHAIPLAVFASPWKMWPGEWRNLICWDKGGGVGGGGDTATCLKRTWELIQVRDNPPFPNGERPESVWRFPVSSRDYVHHIAAKPVRLIAQLMATFAPPGGVILDPCCGTGPTLLAARDGGWPAVGIELDADNCRKAVARLENTRSLFAECA